MPARAAIVSGAKIDARLGGVPETALWTLWNRARDAAGPRPLLRDERAVELMQRIDYDFGTRFGKPRIVHSIRSRFADELIAVFLRRRPDGAVVALGEGLETQFWRIDNGRVRWFSVDLPQSIAARRSLLPAHERIVAIEASAVGPEWLAKVPHDGPTFISAAGLFMYLDESQVVALLRAVVQAFSEGELFFDTIPAWFSRKTLKGWNLTPSYTVPPMPFALPLGSVPEFMAQVPGLHAVTVQTFAEPYPDRMRLLAWLSRVPALKNRVAPGLVHARFKRDAAAT
jgi:O-methyltransferase involved in polyketide biosynthesis